MSPKEPARSTRRHFLHAAAAASAGMLLAGCSNSGGPQAGRLEAVWGRRGTSPGMLNKPRAIAIDKDDLLYIVDFTPHIHVFTGDGGYVRGWQPPVFTNGRPSGLAFNNAGNLLVADTHNYRMLVYTPQGKLLDEQTIGGTCGFGDGEFQFVTDAAQDSQGNYYITQYGEFDRIQKFSPEGQFLLAWGEHGSELGQFMRPQKIVIDQADLVWVTDACNHRVQVFDARGSEAKLIQHWGTVGREPGQLRYPYDILLDNAALAGQPDGRVYLCEFGNHRVQKFTTDGQFVGLFGENGHREGQLDQPWGIARDSQGRMFVLDSYNHRVQRFRL
ncbi:MAG TPA: NHL repeat-containing protein [Pirellulaceae bacterium]|nr:NHL repeat-containing protein [Pirellulaceae bacterium]